MNKTKIEWCDSTWNPVTGCLHGCEYCYARNIAKRFEPHSLEATEELKRLIEADTKGTAECTYMNYPLDGRTKSGKVLKSAYPFGFRPTFHAYKLDEPKNWKDPRTIFVCSMADLFGKWVSDHWIDLVMKACMEAPQHRYLFLTKNPRRYAELALNGRLPATENMWYGTTITTPEGSYFYSNAHRTFLSIEPIMADFDVEKSKDGYVDWIVCGAETGNRKGKVIPEKKWVD